jgi:hypothetical protein
MSALLPKADIHPNPNTNRRVEFEKLLTAAGAKLVGMYATMADGSGAIAIFDADPAVAPSAGAVATSSDGVHNLGCSVSSPWRK